MKLLDKKGSNGLSMRSLALALNVTPMAIYNHFPDRSSLLSNVSDMVYAEVMEEVEKFEGKSRDKLEYLLLTYHTAVINHPNLSISIFEDPNGFSIEVQKITQEVRNILDNSKLKYSEKEMWLDILVDFTHGNALAISMSQIRQQTVDILKNESLKYKNELNLLLNTLF